MIDILPDDVLLEIFDFYREETIFWVDEDLIFTWTWMELIQVCRRWRCVIFGSPRRLDLRVICTGATPTGTSLDMWPPFPIDIVFWGGVDYADSIIAALEHGHDRISQISIDDIEGRALGELAAAIQQPFPALKCCCIRSYDKSALVLPETFLGGSAPVLEHLELYGVPFPAFPQFISSSTHLRHLSILNIPDSGYISPDAMAACLAALPNLQYLSIEFQSPLSHPSHITPPPRTRIVLPALTDFVFQGASEYFDDFVAQIDAPLLTQ
jgi:hypothetical protein